MYFEIKSIANNLKPFLDLTIPIFLLLLGWLCVRAGSWYPILVLAWKVIVSKEENKNEHINDFLASQRDLYQFRVFTTIKARTSKHAEQIIQWCVEKNISHEQINICGNLFDLEELRVREEKLPSKRYRRLVIFPALVIFTVCFSISTSVALNNSAALEFKNGGKNFWINETEAKPIFTLSNEVLTKNGCTTIGDGKSQIFTIDETSKICEFFKSSDLNSTIERTVRAQRFVFGYFSFVFFSLILMIFIYLRKVNTCKDLLKKISPLK